MMPTWTLDRFDGGLDVRDGAFSEKQNRFREVKNYYVTSGKKLVRRQGLKRAVGAFGADTTGIIEKGGLAYTLCPAGGGATVPDGVTPLPFDVPSGATIHVLMDVVSLNNVPCAIIRHTVGAVQYYALHIFDNDPNQFTFVNDIGFPWMTQLNPTTRPCLGVSAGKLYCGGPTGDVSFSAVGKPRVWNNRTTDQMKAGRDFVFYLPVAGTQSMQLPLKFSDYGGYFPAMVVSKFTGDALSDFSDDPLWSTITDTSVGGDNFGAVNTIRYASAPNTKPGATVTTFGKINANPSVGGVWYRARIVRQRITRVLTGAFYSVAFGGLVGLTHVVYGDGAKNTFNLPATFRFVTSTPNWIVLFNGVIQANPAVYAIQAIGNTGAAVKCVAAPANGTLIEVRQMVASGTSFEVVVAPGTVRSFDGSTQDFLGGVITLPASTSGMNVYIKFKADGTIDSANNGGLSFTLPGIGLNFLGDRYYYGCEILAVSTNGTGVSSYGGNTAPELTAGPPASERALAGYGDAGFLPTSKHPGSGGLVTDITGTKNRILVRYNAGSQIWDVRADPTQDSIVSLLPYGSGDNTIPHGVLFFGQTVIVPTSTGFRAAAINDVQKLGDSLHDDQDVGAPVSGLGEFVFQSAAFWPRLSMYVAACTINGSFSLMCFVYHGTESISAWSQFTFTGLTSTDIRGIVAVGDRLYIRSATDLFYIEASAVAGQCFDYNETTLTAFTSRLVGHFNNLKAPSKMKRTRAIDVMQTGKAVFRFRVNPYDESQETRNLQIEGPTLGRGIVPMSAAGKGLCMVVESQDANGHQIDDITIEFMADR